MMTSSVACKYTQGRCYRERCNTVLCCQAQEQLAELAEANAAPQALQPSDPGRGVDKLVPAEPAWLIERGQRLGHAPTIWFVGRGTSALSLRIEDEWTTDANKAQRFKTREEAELEADRLFARYSGDPQRLADVTEHVFLNF